MNSNKIYLYEEVYVHLKNLIEKDILNEDEKMPSKRRLAENFNISPLTVEKAYAQLIDEGYVYSVEKKGYFVSKKVAIFKPTFSVKQEITKNEEIHSYKYDFSTGKVDTSYFPHKTWAKLAREVLSEQHHQMLNEIDPMGLFELREEIAKHIEIYRGIQVDPNQIFVGSSSTQLLNLLIEILGRQKIYGIEDPTYPKIYHLFKSLDIQTHLIEVDDMGLNIDKLKQTNIDIIHVVPSHQYPTGVMMTIQRRKALLNWVYQSKERYIIEDDYDSEFKYQGKPAEALRGLDQQDKVIYMNTFSKSLAPSFRVAYLVLPKHLLPKLMKISKYHRCTVPNFEQYILYKFMHNEHFSRHLHRMMKVYRQKLELLLNLTKVYQHINIKNYESGLHFILSFKSNISETKLLNQFITNDIYVQSVSTFRHKQDNSLKTIDLVIGYSGLTLLSLEEGYKKLLNIINNYV
jgi:GntR family transcriptional regulator / MocR family aminotransferase